MAVLTVRNVPDEVHRALRVRAASRGRSTEAEVRAILEAAVKPESRLRMGDALAAVGRHAGLTDAELDAIARARDKRPAKPIGFA
jgi:plasmid stability protein